MKNTRQHDIEYIERSVAKGYIDRKTASQKIDMLHKQTKDVNIEGFRKKLIEAMKKDDDRHRHIRQNVNKLSTSEQRRLIDYFNKNPGEF